LADQKSYRPIAKLSVLSKLLERLVARQLLNYLNASRLLSDRQSAYLAYHFTETAVTKVLADILLVLDKGDIATLTLRNLSAAFHPVDHAIVHDITRGTNKQIAKLGQRWPGRGHETYFCNFGTPSKSLKRLKPRNFKFGKQIDHEGQKLTEYKIRSKGVK